VTVEVALEALTSDAKKWHDTSTTLATAASQAEGLTLTDVQLSWASQETGLQATYEQIRSRVAGLLSEGATETDRIGDTLITVRKTYESTDDDARAALNGVWTPK
jgi:hypothetical protein